MKTLIQAIILLSLALATNAQIRFEKGYIIDTRNNKTECLIRNPDWTYNPVEITWKASETAEPVRTVADSIREFGIYGGQKYIAAEVDIDRSPAEIDKLSRSRNPEFSRERLLLRVLVEGTASLYSYSENNLQRFFFSTPQQPVSQLIWKEYLNKDGSVATNQTFRQQLMAGMNCGKTGPSSVKNLVYLQSDLRKYFTEYNRCIGLPENGSQTAVQNKTAREAFNFRIKSGINYSSLSILSNITNHWNSTYPDKAAPALALDIEGILPFHRNKWALTLEPTWFRFRGATDISGGSAAVDYSAVELPIGIRHYFHLDENNKLFMTYHIIPGMRIDFGSTIRVYSTDYDVNPEFSMSFGGGYSYKRLSAEIRYYTNNDLLGDYIEWSTDYGRISLLIGYKFLKINSARR